jgi:ribonuclease P protein component
MLHTDWRINRGKEYRAIYNRGKRVVGRYMIIFACPNCLPYNRFGIVTSKKIGNAVVRNRALYPPLTSFV